MFDEKNNGASTPDSGEQLPPQTDSITPGNPQPVEPQNVAPIVGNPQPVEPQNVAPIVGNPQPVEPQNVAPITPPPAQSYYVRQVKSSTASSQSRPVDQWQQGGDAHNHQPVAPPPGIYYAGERQQPKKRRVIRIVAAVLVLTVLLSGAGILATLYEITPTGDGFTVQRRNSEQPDTVYASADPKTPDDDNRLQAGGVQNGPSLTISPAQNVNAEPSLNGELSIQQIAAKCEPSSVGIVAMSDSYYYGTATSTGTGVIMSDDGYIITNNHVIDGASSISVTLNDGREYEAQLIGSDRRSDLAVLKIEARELVAAEFGDSDTLMVGDLVVAIGNPLGLEFMGTVTDGIVSAINRDVVIEERTMTLIQTNAAINSGNSGGPLFNAFGQVIGIVNSKMQSYSTTVEGLGFAIPTNTVKEIVDELIQYGYVKGWPSIGIDSDNVTERMGQYYNIPIGVLVNYVSPNANSYAAGLQVNDIIVEADGQKVSNEGDLSRIKELFKAGDSFTIKVYRYASKDYHDITFVLNDEAELSVNDSTRLIP